MMHVLQQTKAHGLSTTVLSTLKRKQKDSGVQAFNLNRERRGFGWQIYERRAE